MAEDGVDAGVGGGGGGGGKGEGDGEGGYSYGAGDGASIPLVAKHAVEDEGDVVFDGDEELANHGMSNGNTDPSQTELVLYAHRDLKPG